MERAADFQLLFCVWLDGPTRSRVGCVTFYWGERKRPILFCLQGTVVELYRQGVTKLFQQIEMIETLAFSYTY